MLADQLVKTVQEEERRLRRPYAYVQAVAGGVVEEEEGDPLGAGPAGAEVLAVAQHALHTVHIAPAPHVSLALAGTGTGRQAHASAGPPHRGPVHGQVFRDDASHSGSTQQLGHRGAGVAPFLGAQEGHQCFGQNHGSVGAGAVFGLQGGHTAVGVGGPPALDRAHADAHGTAVQMSVVSRRHLAHRRTGLPAAQDEGFDLGQHRVA